MAVTNEQIQQWFQSNPGASDTDVYNAMQTYKVDPTQLTTAMNFNPTEVQSRYQAQQAAAPQGLTSLTQTPPPVYNQYTDQGITGFFQDLATKNARGAYSPDMYDIAGQIKDAIKTYNPDIDQVNRILNSGATVPIYGGANAGGTNVNLKDFANEFAMATSKTPLVDANGRITLDPKLAAQAAQNELDTLFDPNRGSLMPIKNADFELGGKYYGRGGERDKMIADWYNDPANKAKLDAAQKTVFDKYGVPTDMRLAPRAISSMLAKNEVKPASSMYVDPIDYASYADYIKAQNASSLKAFQDELATYKKYGIDRLQNNDPRLPNSDQIKMANLRAGLGGRDETSEANFYGMTLENLKDAKSGRDNSYFNTLRTPLERLAEETARSAGLGKPSEKALALAKKYPDIFAKASKEWAQYLSNYMPQKKAGGGRVKETVMPDGYRAGGRVKLI
jgi:hypothetical protein